MKNFNTKTDGYYEIRYKGAVISAYAKLVKNTETKKCDCCGRACDSYFRTCYIDENSDEVFNIFGTECFKKIATWDDSIFAF